MVWNKQKIIGVVYFLLFFIVSGYSLYHRGLFFRPEQTYVGTAVIVVGLIAMLVLRVMKRLFLPAWLWLMFVYAGYALLTTLWAADAELAVGGAITVLAAITLAAFIPQLSNSFRRLVLLTLPLYGLLLYLFAMANAVGWFHFANAIQTNMMDSTFQYHNTFGSFTLAGALIALTFASAEKDFWRQMLLYLLACLNLVGVLASYSRWVWILTLCMLLVSIGASYFTGYRLQTLVSTILTGLTAAGAGAFSILSIHKQSVSDFMISLVVAILGVAVFTYLTRRVVGLSSRKSRVWASLPLILLPLILGIVLITVDAKHFGSIVTRIESIRLHSASLQGRFWFYGAALHMWERNPIFGAGAGAWAAKFQAFQQFPYYSTETHSVFFSQLTSYGIVGTLLWLLVIGFGLWKSIQSVLKNRAGGVLQLAALLATLSLLIHALMDFDMDFPIIVYFFFVVLGLAVPRKEVEVAAELPKPVSVSVTLSLAGVMAFVSVFAVGLSIAEAALTAVGKTKDVNSQVALLKRAETFAPYVAMPHLELATYYFNQYNATHASSLRNQAWNEAQYAVKRGMWNADVQIGAANIAYQLGNTSQAYHWSLRSAQDAPFYTIYASTFMGMALWSGAAEYPNNPQDAQRVFQSIVYEFNLVKSNEEALKRIAPAIMAQWESRVQAFQMTDPMKVYAAAAHYGLGQYQRSLGDLQSVSAAGQDVNSLGLQEMVQLLDKVHLQNGNLGQVLGDMKYHSPILTQEFDVLARIRPNTRG